MPTFTPKSDSELQSERLLPKGEYDFEILKAENKISKTSGAGMIALTVGVYTGNGDRQQWVNDNLVFVEKAMFKVSQFAKATGLYQLYKAGRIDAQDCVGRGGRCKVDIEPEGDYPAKNKITSYVAPKEVAPLARESAPAPVQSQTATPPPAEDDVPF